MNILFIFLAFSFLILIHEFGHFIIARANKVEIEEFSIGMGPQILKIIKNKTMFSIRLFPIGGFVKMLGENKENLSPNSFNSKSPLRKISILAAGAVMNILLAVTIISITSFKYGYLSLTIDKVQPNFPAYSAGLRTGDVLAKVNSSRVFTWEDFKSCISVPADTGDITFIRNNKEYTVKIPYSKTNSSDGVKLGVYSKIINKPSIIQSIKHSLNENASVTKQIFAFLKHVIQGKAPADSFGGPVAIVKASSSIIKISYGDFLSFMAFISLQLGILNLMPFPALDGFHIFICLYELLTGKKAGGKKLEIANTLGFSILMIFMVVVTIKDILYPINL